MDDIRLAVLSDIHGNTWALRAVLSDIKQRGIQEIVNLGDSLYGPLDPAGTFRILIDLELPTVRGNEDRILLHNPEETSESTTLGYVRHSLTPEALEWLKAQPLSIIVREMFFLCHGSPDSDSEYLLTQVKESGVFLRDGDDLNVKISSVKQPIILCGHDHFPRTVAMPAHTLIINPGSVGLPAYWDDCPFPHTMQTGTPHARYAVISHSDSGWKIEDVAVPYDWKSAADMARKNGRNDWAKWLLYGRADSL